MRSLGLKEKTSTICGVFISECGVEVPLYFDKKSKEVFYYYDCGEHTQVIEGLNLTGCKICSDYRKLIESIYDGEYGQGVIGIIFSSKYAVMITTDVTAENRCYEDLTIQSEDYFIIDMMINGKSGY